MALQNDTFIRALLGQPTPYTPIWLMRQAGRYLPEYNATRKRAGSFLGLAKSPAYATEVTLQPLDRFPLDAAILFSDILTVPDAMGLGLYFADGEGPKFKHPLRDERAIMALAQPPMESLRYVTDAVTEIRRALSGRVPLIGFSGSPWTLACYMVEGGGSDDFRTVKSMLYARPDLIHRILEANTIAVTAYLNAQIDEAAGEIVLKKRYHIGVAAATEAGLVVPVVRDADTKSIRQLIEEIRHVGEGARTSTLPAEEMSGSTFTITSLGKLGGMFATPIVNYPESAILGLHKCEKRPAVVDGQIVIRDRMYMSCSFDHRLIDGHVGAGFVQSVKTYLEQPALLLAELV